MKKTVQYSDNDGRDRAIQDNATLRLIEELNIAEGNFLIFTDEEPPLIEVIDEKVNLMQAALDELILGGI